VQAADPVADALKKVESYRAGAEKDLDYVAKYATNCTTEDHFKTLRDMALIPAKKNILGYGKALNEGLAGVLDDDGTCKAITKSQADAALKAIRAVADDVESFQSFLASKSKEAFYMNTYDEIMLKVLAAESGYPKCVAANPADVNSNPESRHYLAYKQRLDQMANSLSALRVAVKAKLKHGCKTASVQTWQSASLEEGDSGSAL
jgi:hypothetical protein